MALDLRNNDYASKLREWQESDEFNDLNRKFVHGRFYGLSVEGGTVPQDLMDHILGQMLNYFSATATSREAFRRERDAIMKMWPEACARMAQDPGLAQLMIEHGAWSRHVFPFLEDIWFQPALSFLPGFGLARTVDDQIVPLDFSDRLVTYTQDCTFGMELHRTSFFQPYAREAKHLLLLGGGVAPILWAWKYPLGELDQEIIIYDNSPKMPKYLESLIGRPLSEVGIDYRVADIDEAFRDPELQGWASFIDAAGLAAYFDNNADYFYNGIAALMAPEGLVGFDYTLMDPTFAFVLKTCHWQSPFKVEPDVATANQVAKHHTGLANLHIVDSQAGPVKQPVSVAFIARHGE